MPARQKFIKEQKAKNFFFLTFFLICGKNLIRILTLIKLSEFYGIVAKYLTSSFKDMFRKHGWDDFKILSNKIYHRDKPISQI